MPPNSLASAEMVGLISMGLDPSAAPSLRMSDAAPADPMEAAGAASALRQST
jgi:hypothetical protein